VVFGLIFSNLLTRTKRLVPNSLARRSGAWRPSPTCEGGGTLVTSDDREFRRIRGCGRGRYIIRSLRQRAPAAQGMSSKPSVRSSTSAYRPCCSPSDARTLPPTSETGLHGRLTASTRARGVSTDITLLGPPGGRRIYLRQRCRLAFPCARMAWRATNQRGDHHRQSEVRATAWPCREPPALSRVRRGRRPWCRPCYPGAATFEHTHLARSHAKLN
jgi:hypothetical protein